MATKKKVPDAEAIALREMWLERQAKVKEIEAMYPTQRELCEELGISMTALNNILYGGRVCSRSPRVDDSEVTP